MADPVSWLMIEKGWKVLVADGTEVGDVTQLVGDDSMDIFDGVAITTGAPGGPRYVPAEQVDEITEGAVRLTLTADEVGRLDEFHDVQVEKIVPIPEPESLWQRFVGLFKRG